MAVFNKFEQFVEDLCDGEHLFKAASDTIEIYLSNATPSTSADAVKTDLAEITNENGYAAPQDTQNTSSETSGTNTVVGTDITITASGGTIGPFRYVVLFNTSATTKTDPLIGWWDYGSSITLQNGESFTVDFGASLFTVA